MQNKQMNPINKTDQVDEIVKRLRGTSRLSGSDKKVFAINLGSLAFRLNEKNPRGAAKQIVEHSGQAGIWEKRKRFFRFPDEEAPEFGKEGEYALKGGVPSYRQAKGGQPESLSS